MILLLELKSLRKSFSRDRGGDYLSYIFKHIVKVVGAEKEKGKAVMSQIPQLFNLPVQHVAPSTSCMSDHEDGCYKNKNLQIHKVYHDLNEVTRNTKSYVAWITVAELELWRFVRLRTQCWRRNVCCAEGQNRLMGGNMRQTFPKLALCLVYVDSRLLQSEHRKYPVHLSVFLLKHS